MGNFPSITRERTLVGLAAPSQHCNVPRCDFTNNACTGTTPVSVYGSSGSGTSFAAPVVSGAAILAKHRWIALSSPASYLDHAGRLRAHMLLMGDRLANDGTSKLLTGYSTKYGAGRLRQRYFSGPGMDSPWDQRAGSATLSNGQSFLRWVTPSGSLGTIASDANRLVVVAWWFETNLAQAADFTMTIDTFDPTCTNLISTTLRGHPKPANEGHLKSGQC